MANTDKLKNIPLVVPLLILQNSGTMFSPRIKYPKYRRFHLSQFLSWNYDKIIKYRNIFIGARR